MAKRLPTQCSPEVIFPLLCKRVNLLAGVISRITKLTWHLHQIWRKHRDVDSKALRVHTRRPRRFEQFHPNINCQMQGLIAVLETGCNVTLLMSHLLKDPSSVHSDWVFDHLAEVPNGFCQIQISHRPDWLWNIQNSSQPNLVHKQMEHPVSN